MYAARTFDTFKPILDRVVRIRLVVTVSYRKLSL